VRLVPNCDLSLSICKYVTLIGYELGCLSRVNKVHDIYFETCENNNYRNVNDQILS
jgi:hypothetical protein